LTDDSISGPESTPVPARPGKNRAWTALVLALFLLPLGVLLGQYWALGSDRSGAEREAEKELASLRPRRAAWGVLGTIRLEQGRINEALPLLRKASDMEAAAGDDSHDTLALVQAELKGAGEGMPGASQKAAERALLRAEALAPKLPQGRQAATWFSAGTFWQELGRRKKAVADLQLAVALQPDDWVDDGGGRRYKSAGLSAYYQKMLAGAMEP
jgi:tetratricopeptide (TPR) repeat protein